MLISICTLVPEFNGLVSKRAKRKRGLFALYTFLIQSINKTFCTSSLSPLSLFSNKRESIKLIAAIIHKSLTADR